MNLNSLYKKLKTNVASGISFLRTALVIDLAKSYVVMLDRMRVTGTGAALGTAAGTPAGALGLTVGTFATNSPKLIGEAASNNSKTDKCRFLFPLPVEYVAAGAVTVRIRCKETVGAATVATSIDCECYKSDKEAGIGTDLCTTAAQDVTTEFGNKDFVITPAGLAPGDLLDIQLTAVTNDTGGAVGTIINITNVELLLDVQG
ncbi:MAG: hypothetical protein JSS49_30495 [Planctomycetes bacterium]|nr:hypothetical protein [Planctomycetota bacterium]